MKKLITIALVSIMAITAQATEAQVEAQVKALTENIIKTDKALQASLSTPENIKECKKRLSMFKQYMAFQEKYPQRNQEFNESIIKDCKERVQAVCGVIMSASHDKTEIAND